MIGALPGIWTLEYAIRHPSTSEQAIAPEWSLLDALSEARRLYDMAGAKTISKLRREVAETVGQESIGFGDQALTGLGQLNRLGVALGVALLRAGRRKDPQGAAAGLVARYVEEARKASQVVSDMFAAPVDPAAELGRIAKWVDPRPRSQSETRV